MGIIETVVSIETVVRDENVVKKAKLSLHPDVVGFETVVSNEYVVSIETVVSDENVVNKAISNYRITRIQRHIHPNRPITALARTLF